MAAAAEKQAELEAHFEKLNALAGAGQHQKVLKAVETILKLSPADVDALKCRAVAHLQLGEYEEAWKALGHRKLEGEMTFERAYCLYRLGRFADALDAVAGAAEADAAAALQLRAQLAYRTGDAAGCVAAYDELITGGPEGGALEVQTNVLAAYVAAGMARELPALMARLRVAPKASFEVGYNAACGLVAAGELPAAETALRVAIKQGEESLYEEDFAEEEVLDELAPLTVQLAYVLAASGRPGDAVARLEPLVAGELSDASAAAVAANNYVAAASAAADGHAKGFLGKSARRLDALLDKSRSAADPLALQPELASRLSAEQARAVHLNRALLYLQSGKADAAGDVADALAKAHPSSAAVAMLRATLLARCGKAAEADAVLAAVVAAAGGPGAAVAAEATEAAGAAAGEPRGALLPQLLRAQLALEAGDARGALARLAELPPALALAPAVVATRVALLEGAGDEPGAEALLEAALKAAQQQASGGKGAAAAAAAEGAGWCLNRLVSLKLAAGKGAEALALFQQLAKLGGGGTSVASSSAGAAVRARLARAAAAAGDADAAAALERELPGGRAAVEKLGRDLDVDALEDSGRAFVSAARRRDAAAAAASAAADADDDDAEAAATRARKREAGVDGEQPKHKRARKKRKAKLPKGYDASKPNGGLPPADPERWLPKWQRAETKKKAKRAGRERRLAGEAVKGSQGAGKVDAALDRGARDSGDDSPDPRTVNNKGKGPALPARKGKGKR